MKEVWSLMSVPIIVCLLYLVVLIADKIVRNVRDKTFRMFWERHIIADFPYNDKCFDCNKTTCKGCKYNVNS
jgi:MoaA/NifB/PqqE/SkfB family radical SAM enzyme